jgi:hypothetical protein
MTVPPRAPSRPRTIQARIRRHRHDRIDAPQDVRGVQEVVRYDVAKEINSDISDLGAGWRLG